MHSLVSMLLLLLLMLASMMCCQLLVIGKFLGAHTTLDCTLPLVTLPTGNVLIVLPHIFL